MSTTPATTPTAPVEVIDGVDAAIVELAAWGDRMLAAAQAHQVRVLAHAGQWAELQAAGSDARTKAHDMALRSIAADIGGVTRVSDRTVQARIGEARTIVEDYPHALVAWEAGRITRGHIRVIVDAGMTLPTHIRPDYEAAAVEWCERDTPNRVKPHLEMLAETLHPQTLTERHAQAATCRRIRVVRGQDAMSDIIATVPTVIAEGVFDRLTQQATGIIDARGNARDILRNETGAREDGTDAGLVNGNDAGFGDGNDAGLVNGISVDAIATDTRTMDQVRADVFADLLLAGAPALDPTGTGDGVGPLGAIRARVQVVVPATTLTGADEAPASLVGRSPIDAGTARTLAGDRGVWERIFTDPITGTTTAVDSYRVPTRMRRYLQARDQHCRFPGCRIAAIRCEIDHTHDAAKGGPTALNNLGHLCQRHHSMKQFTAWRVKQHPGGVLEWTSPTGRIYREDLPKPAVTTVAFVPTGPPQPPAPAEPPGSYDPTVMPDPPGPYEPAPF